MYGDEMGPEMMAPGAELESEAAPVYDDEESEAIAQAMPEIASDPERLSAFKLAIQMCVDRILTERDSDTGSKGSTSEKSPAGKPGSLALIFGGKDK